MYFLSHSMCRLSDLYDDWSALSLGKQWKTLEDTAILSIFRSVYCKCRRFSADAVGISLYCNKWAELDFHHVCFAQNNGNLLCRLCRKICAYKSHKKLLTSDSWLTGMVWSRLIFQWDLKKSAKLHFVLPRQLVVFLRGQSAYLLQRSRFNLHHRTTPNQLPHFWQTNPNSRKVRVHLNRDKVLEHHFHDKKNLTSQISFPVPWESCGLHELIPHRVVT